MLSGVARQPKLGRHAEDNILVVYLSSIQVACFEWWTLVYDHVAAIGAYVFVLFSFFLYFLYFLFEHTFCCCCG